MQKDEFLRLLNSIDFSEHYWALCERFPLRPGSSIPLRGKKEDVIDAFHEVGVTARYDSRDRSFLVEEETIGDLTWHALFVKQRSGGVELMIGGEGGSEYIGSNFAVLAYEAKQQSDSMFKRDPFKGPPPYPRPHYNNDQEVLRALVKEFIALVRLIKAALRRHAATAV